ncbi:MAG: DUF5719 family protein [Actinomycetota bacterium]
MKYGEWIFAAAVTAILALGLGLDVLLESRPVREAELQAPDHLASGSYCPVPSGDISATMTTANFGDAPLGLRRSAVGAVEPDAEQIALEPQRLSSVNVGELTPQDSTGVVDVFGGRAHTSLTVLSQGMGIASALCTDQPSARWLFATGSTLRDDDHYLLVSNPFREEALVSVRIMGSDQDVNLPLISEEVVRARSQRIFYLSESLEEVPSFGMELVASRGRVVVSRYSSVNVPGTKGISLNVGTGSPATQWYFPNGRVPTEGEESLVIVNPTSREALLSVLFLTEGERVAPPDLAEVVVPAGRQVTINTSEHLSRGDSHGVSLVSLNEVPVVAERQIRGVVGSIRGFESAFGLSELANQWVLPVGTPEGGTATLAIVNPGQSAAEVDIRLVTAEGEVAPQELVGVEVAAGRKVSLDLTGYLGGGPATAEVEAAGAEVAVDSTTGLEGSYGDFSTTPGFRVR